MLFERGSWRPHKVIFGFQDGEDLRTGSMNGRDMRVFNNGHIKAALGTPGPDLQLCATDEQYFSSS